ncbi:putative ribonuclease H-like domain-containing protein [Tanacetum coccineum]
MTTFVEHIINAGAENRPPMLEKSVYDSWASRIRLFIKGKKHGRMMLDSNDNDDCDVQATNIILRGLPPDVYPLVNHQEAAKDFGIESRCTELSNQERECRLYNLFDKFAYVQGETLKFVTDVKLAKSLYTTNYDQLYAYLSQHKQHANEVRIQNQSYAGTENIEVATTSKGKLAAGQPRVMKCYNCQGEGHMVRQCTQPKRPRNVAWFKENLMLAEAQEAGQILDEEQLAFLADPGISEAPVAKQTIP